MATGDLVKLGALYVNGTVKPRPTKPWRNTATAPGGSGNGDIPDYTAGHPIEIRNTPSNEANQLHWREIVDGNKKYLISDRVLLSNISWNDLNAQELVKGKKVTIDGQEYLLRIMTGGEERREGGTGGSYGGGKLPNEWDRWIVNEANLPGLPKPTATDLDSDQTATDLNGTHNQFWNWLYIRSWCQDVYKHDSAYRATRGYHSARYWYWYFATRRFSSVGWRPVLEVLNSAPLISGGSQNLGNKTGPFSVVYQVSDPEGHSVNVTEKINGKIVRAQTGVPQKQDLEMIVTLDQWKEIPLNKQSTIEIEAIDEKGAKSTRVYTFSKTNAPPVAKAIEPTGDLANIAITPTVNPTFVYRFEDSDPGDIQTAMQLIIEDTNGNTIHDSGKKQTAQSFYQLPESEKLEWGTRYKWKVRVWDKFDIPSEYSFPEFFLPNRPPNVSNLRPGSNEKDKPEGASLTPTFEWDFEDLDLEAQAAYQLIVRTTETDAEIYNTSKINRAVKEHTIPDFVLSEGTAYYAQVTVWDPNGLSGKSEKAYIVTNATPTPPLLTTPINNYRTTLQPTLSGIVGTDKEDDGQHFLIQISQNAKFEGEVLTYRSDQDRTGWQVNGFDIPEEGVKNDQAGQTVSYAMQVQLDANKKYYWRMAAVDASTKAIGKFGEIRHIRVGNKLAYDTLVHPIDTGAVAANRVLVALDYAMAQDGSRPSEIKVSICNNANDVSPTWEDMTDAFLEMDYHTFENKEKTAETWAVALKVEIVANDTMGDIFIASHGFTFD